MTIPNEERVKAACDEFDHDYLEVEETLEELFGKYRDNSVFHHVLAKVVALNAFYSTRIPVYSETLPNVFDVARHICQNAHGVDSALLAGSPEIVDKIAEVAAPGKKRMCYFAFATKYCSWHNHLCYPIYDSRVHQYLRYLRKHGEFAADFHLEGHWKYPAFRDLMDAFREKYRLGSISFKDIDKFLWMSGEKLYRERRTAL